MDANWVSALAAIAQRAPSADNSQPWTLRWNGQELEVWFTSREHRQDVFAAHSHATLLSVGAVLQHLQAALTANGVQSDLRWPANPALGTPYATLSIQNAPDSFVAPNSLQSRHTNRGRFKRTPLPTETVRDFGQRGNARNRLLLLVERPQKSSLIRLVRLCSEARFCNQRLHEWLVDSLRFSPEAVARGDGLDVNALCLPPGGKQFLRFTADWRRLEMLNRMGAYRLLARSEVALLSAAPALICIVGRAYPDSVIDAGQLLSHTWTDLNVSGLAVHPYYVVADQINRLHDGTIARGFETKIAAVEAELRPLLGLQPDEILHMILRVGYGKIEAVRSKRLPVESILVES